MSHSYYWVFSGKKSTKYIFQFSFKQFSKSTYLTKQVMNEPLDSRFYFIFGKPTFCLVLRNVFGKVVQKNLSTDSWVKGGPDNRVTWMYDLIRNYVRISIRTSTILVTLSKEFCRTEIHLALISQFYLLAVSIIGKVPVND